MSSPTYTIPAIPATFQLPAADDYIEQGGQTRGSGKNLLLNFPQKVAVISSLVALSVSAVADGVSVYVQGYYTAGDGGGGWFRYSSSSAATTNGGTVLAPNAGGGRWLRDYAGAVNVRWFGAKCDGTTNDGAAVQAALTNQMFRGGDSTVAGGGTVVIDSPCNFGSTTINVGSTGASADDIDGRPVNLQLQYFGNSTGSANPLFQLGSRSRIQGINRRFTRITKTGAGAIIQITAPSEDCDITDLRLEGGANAVKLKASSTSGDVPSIRLERIFAENQTGDAFALCGMADGFLMNEIFTAASGGAGLRVGIMDGNTTGASNENSRVTNCLFQGAGTKGVWIETDSAPLQASQAMVNTTFDNVQIASPANEAFFFKMLTSGGLQLNNIQLVGLPTAASNTYSAIRFNGAFGGIAGVTIENVGGAGTANWKYIFEFSGSGAYGTKNLIRNYQTNGAVTSVFNLDSNSGVRIADIGVTTGLSGFEQPTKNGIGSVAVNGAGVVGKATGAFQVAGNAGEILSVFVASGSAVAMTTDVAANIASLALTAGNWLITAVTHWHGQASSTASYDATAINTASAALPSLSTGQRADSATAFQTVLTDKSRVLPAVPMTLNGTTTIYLVGLIGFSGGTFAAYGSIVAVRLP